MYRYLPGTRTPLHQLALVKPGTLRDDLGKTVGQNSINSAPGVIIITGDFAKMASAFDGARSDYDVYLEAGHVGQNLYLESESLGLGMVTLTGFTTDKVATLLTIPENETIIYIIPIGVPKN